MKSFLRLCFFNVIVLVTMLGFVSYGIPFVFFVKDIAQNYVNIDERTKEKAFLPNYQGIEWAKQYFIEERKLSSSEYYDYTLWRRKSFHGITINIDENGIRQTTNTNVRGKKVFFFGGSIMWGKGSNDANTIPSLFSKITHTNTTNFAEGGWTAHQSLNMLQKLYAQGERPDIVVFYDGGTDVTKCRKDLSFFSSHEEPAIRNAILPDYIYSYAYLFAPVMRLISSVRDEESESKHVYDCDKDQIKARAIAEALYIDWLSAKQLVEWYGGKFYAVLQPLAYIGQPRLDHLPYLNKYALLRTQLNIVYPLFIDVLNQNQFHFLDFTSIYDRDEYIYIDYCHVSPNGSQLVAERFAAEMGL